jgi:SAM-dependent methyltransferase
MTTKRPYLLGDSRVESGRLRRQAALWDPVAHALFDRIGVQRGWHVLEIGPGQGSLHMELRRRVHGPIDAVEPSAVFARRLEQLQRCDQLGPGAIWKTNLHAAPLPRNRYDLIFARWVFLFVPDPFAAIQKLAAALRPGGILAIQDYHRETVALIPRPDDWRDFIAAERACFAAQESDVSVGGLLPALYTRAGLEVVEVIPTIKFGTPGSAVWKWLTTYFLGMLDRYAQFPPMTKAKAARLRRAWLTAERDPTSVLIAPAVLDVVGRKASRRRRRSG